jgi:hypothetical protein
MLAAGFNDACVVVVGRIDQIGKLADNSQGDSITQTSATGTYYQLMAEYYERRLDVVNRGFSGVLPVEHLADDRVQR